MRNIFFKCKKKGKFEKKKINIFLLGETSLSLNQNE